MQAKSYPSKWLITYRGKPYMSVYGKKKAYDLCVRLSHCVNGLQVEAAPKRKNTSLQKDKREYHREWRATNKDRVREYNKRSYQKRKQKLLLEKISEEGFEIMDQTAAQHAEAYHDYLRWLKADIPEWMYAELENMTETDIADCFGEHLAFGTGGLRAEIGAGTNRMNTYTVRKATQGLAAYIKGLGSKFAARGVAIAYDSRRFSREFAEEAALVLAYNGIKAYVFDTICPTPILSYAVRYLKTSAGIVITASHNPRIYNGYKVYGADGAQISPQTAAVIMDAIDRVEDELTVGVMDRSEAVRRKLYIPLSQDMFDHYYGRLMSIVQDHECVLREGGRLKIVYTPLHGAGSIPVRQALARAGFRNVHIVPEQEQPDGDFPTVASPNPEDKQALELAIRLAGHIDADIVLGTDPDADRVGLAVRNSAGSYTCLNGNETGALMLDYLLYQMRRSERLPESGVMIKTIVTSELGRMIASSYGIETMETLTGFKYIGEKIKELEEGGDKSFIFGYEESFGYLIGDFVRDKDAVQACLLIGEMAAFYRTQGMTLLDALTKLHDKFGYYAEDQHAITLKGLEGVVRINEIMNYLREHQSVQINGWRVSWIRDFQKGTDYHLSSNMLRSTGLPRSNVLLYSFDNAGWFAVRPSGTEPKLKIYFSVNGKTKEEAELMLAQLKRAVTDLIENIQIHLGLQVVPR